MGTKQNDFKAAGRPSRASFSRMLRERLGAGSIFAYLISLLLTPIAILAVIFEGIAGYLLSRLGDSAAVITSTFIFFSLALVLSILIKGSRDRQGLIETLRRDGGGRLYRALVNRWLDKIDGLVTPPGARPATWSPGVFRAAMFASMTYPIAAAFILWALTLEGQYLGKSPLLNTLTESEQNSGFAAIPYLATLCFFAALWFAVRTRRRLDAYYEGAPLRPVLIAMAFTFLFFNLSIRMPLMLGGALIARGDGLGGVEVSMTAISLLPICAIMFNAPFSSYLAALALGTVMTLQQIPDGALGTPAEIGLKGFAIGYAVLLVVLALYMLAGRRRRLELGAFLGLAAVATIIPFFVGAGATLFENVVLQQEYAPPFGPKLYIGVALLFYFVLAVALVQRCLTPRRGPNWRYWSAFLGLTTLFIAVQIATIQSERLELDESRRFTLAVLGAFPLINFVFDFVSFSVTRKLMRAGVRTDRGDSSFRPLRYGLLDVLIALILLALLIVTSMAVFSLAKDAGGQSLLDMPQLIEDMRTNEKGGSYWWIYLSLLSTLAPSMLHLSLAFFSLVAGGPTRMRLMLATALERFDSDRLTDQAIASLLPMAGAASIMAPFFMVSGLGYVIFVLSDDVTPVMFKLLGWLAAALN